MGVRAGRRTRPDAAHDADLEDWIDAARRGDPDAYGWIWRRFSPRVHGYVRGRGARSPEDVTSEVFLAAFTSIGRFAGSESDFRAWLFTIAHHKAVDDVRRRDDDVEYDPGSDPRRSPSAEVAALDMVIDAGVRDLLAALTVEQREVLLLRVLGDLSVEQVAVATGRSVGAVKQLYHRAVETSRRTARQRAAPAAGPTRTPRGASRPSVGRIGAPSAVTQAASTPMTEL